MSDVFVSYASEDRARVQPIVEQLQGAGWSVWWDRDIAAGADFIQTQYCFDVPRLRQFLGQVCDMGLDEEVYILIGVGPLRSEKAAEYLRNHVPGVVIPDEVVDRLRKTSTHKKREEGKRICVEIIQQVQDIECVSGVHVMAFRQEELVAEIIEEGGLLPRPMQPLARHSDPRARHSRRRRANKGAAE